jgi:hypothetical protein
MSGFREDGLVAAVFQCFFPSYISHRNLPVGHSQDANSTVAVDAPSRSLGQVSLNNAHGREQNKSSVFDNVPELYSSNVTGLFFPCVEQEASVQKRYRPDRKSNQFKGHLRWYSTRCFGLASIESRLPRRAWSLQ